MKQETTDNIYDKLRHVTNMSPSAPLWMAAEEAVRIIESLRPAALVVEPALGSPEGVRPPQECSPPAVTDAYGHVRCPYCGLLGPEGMLHGCSAPVGWKVVPTPPAEWKLPEPPEFYQWHRTTGWTQDMLPDGYRPALKGEPLQDGDEYKLDPSQMPEDEFCPQTCSGCTPEGNDGWWRTQRLLPLPVESPASQVPVEEKRTILHGLADYVMEITGSSGSSRPPKLHLQDFIASLTAERDALNKRVEELREECRKLNSQIHLTVKEREDEEVDANLWEERFNEMLNNRNELYTKLTESEKSLTDLRALYAWVPVSERLPKREDGGFGGDIIWNQSGGRPHVLPWNIDAATRDYWKFTYWMTPIPLPTAPVVEDAKEQFRAEFEEAWREMGYNMNRSGDKYVSETVRLGWNSAVSAFLAGQNSTKP